MNNALNQLQPYPFEKLRALLGSVQPNADKRPIALSIGEPKRRSPDFVAKALADNLDQMAVYPTTLGERVEDVFFITDANNQPLSDPQLCMRLQEAIVEQLTVNQDSTPEPWRLSI